MPKRGRDKTCRLCNEIKPLDAFLKDGRRKDGRRHTCKDCVNARRRELHRLDPIPTMLRDARRRAERQGVEFSLRKRDVVIPDVCPVLGIKIAVSSTGTSGAAAGSPSIDRLDPKGGYVPGNIAVISHRANTLKLDATPDELLKVLAWVTRAHLKRNTKESGKTQAKKKKG